MRYHRLYCQARGNISGKEACASWANVIGGDNIPVRLIIITYVPQSIYNDTTIAKMTAIDAEKSTA